MVEGKKIRLERTASTREKQKSQYKKYKSKRSDFDWDSYGNRIKKESQKVVTLRQKKYAAK